MTDGVPEVVFTVKNGEWNCVRCRSALGAVRHPFTGQWTVQLPATCQTKERCTREAIATVSVEAHQ